MTIIEVLLSLFQELIKFLLVHKNYNAQIITMSCIKQRQEPTIRHTRASNDCSNNTTD